VKLHKKYLVLFLIVIGYNINGQNKHFYKLDHGYSFQIDTSIWYEASQEKKERKAVVYRRTMGLNFEYDYVFTTDTLYDVTIPFLSITATKTKGNAFDSYKEKYKNTVSDRISSRFDSLRKYISELQLDEKGTIINEENKTIIAFASLKRTDGQSLTNTMALFFNNEYVLQFVFSMTSTDFAKIYPHFENIIKSVKVYE